MVTPPSSAHTGILHFIPASVSAFEYQPSSAPAVSPPNLILWIGGLYDTLNSVTYPSLLASRLPIGWSLAALSLSSAGKSWGVQSLDIDITEIAAAVSYFQSQGRGGKMVLMGHSTGCQDTLHYLVASGKRPMVDGAILQAPVSDREFMRHDMGEEKWAASVAMAEAWIKEGKGEDCLPMNVTAVFPGVAISARRYHSLAAVGDQDDYFSSDLTDKALQRSFGAIPIGTHLLILSGEQDQYVPSHVHVPTMLQRWTGFASNAGVAVHRHSSQQIPKACHNLNGDPASAVDVLIERVLDFVKTIE